MGVQLSTFPALPASIQTVTLEDEQFRVRLTWRHRCQAWYMDLYALDETPLLLGRRLSAGWSPNAGLVIENGPAGYFLVRGLDDYAREDLGANLRLLYYTSDEVAAVASAAAEPLLVTL